MNGPTARITLPAETPRVASALDELESHLDRGKADDGLRLELRLVAEEVLTNLVKYSGTESLELRLELKRESVTLEFRDQGREFNPLERDTPDLDAPLAERPLGGLGIHLVRTLADDIDYHRVNGVNVLRFTKNRT